MTDKTQCQIQMESQVHRIIQEIQTGQCDTHSDNTCSAYDFIQDALDINYITSSQKEYLGSRLLVAFGGPTIWIDTQKKSIEASWWSDSYINFYVEDVLGLDDALEDCFNSF